MFTFYHTAAIYNGKNGPGLAEIVAFLIAQFRGLSGKSEIAHDWSRVPGTSSTYVDDIMKTKKWETEKLATHYASFTPSPLAGITQDAT